MCIDAGDASGGGSTLHRLRNEAAHGRVCGLMKCKAFHALFALLVVAGCKEPAPEPDAAPKAGTPREEVEGAQTTAAPEAKTHAAGEVAADGSITSAVEWFHGSLEDALAEAKKEGKLVFADVGAYWCPPCHRLDEEVFVRKEVGEFIGAGYIAIHVDAEKGEGPDIVAQYNVQAYPTLLVLEPSGIEKGRIVDFVEPDALKVALERIARGDNVLADLVAAVEAEPDDIKARYRLGHAYALAARRKDAEAQFSEVELADPRDEMGLASQVRYDRAMFFRFKLDNELDAAVGELEALQEAFPKSKSAMRAYRLIGRLRHLQGRDDDAIASLDKMLARDPESLGLATSYGWFSFRQNCKPSAALEVVLAAVTRNPKEAELHYLAAELRHLTDDAPGALEAMRKASALEPDSAYYKRQVRRFEALAGA